MRLWPFSGLPLAGRKMPGRIGVGLIIAAAFVVGVSAGWLTQVVPGFIVSLLPQPSPSSTPEPSVSTPTGPDVPVDLYPPLTRPLDAIDHAAGLTSLAVPTTGSGRFSIVPGSVEPVGSGPVTWVRIEIEDGVPLAAEILGPYVMGILTDAQGWGANGRVAFGQTEGVADVRVVFASPSTAETLCPRPHEAALAAIGPADVPSGPIGSEPSIAPEPTAPGPTPSPSASPNAPAVPSCAQQGLVVVNAYYWAAGVPSFGTVEDATDPDAEPVIDMDRVSSHRYLLNHSVGHLLGDEDAACPTSGSLADVMQDHFFAVAPCLPNPWPFPAPPEDESASD